MITEPTKYYYSSFSQDTLIRTQQLPNQPLPGITVPQKQINLERAEEVFKQFEQREQEMISIQPPVVRVKPKPQETVGKPSIEVDTLMAKYQHIGCSPREYFPDTFTLTVLERYYQPIITAKTPMNKAGPLSVSTPDSFQVIIPAFTVEIPTVQRGFVGELRKEVYTTSITLFIICTLIFLTIIKNQFRRNMLDTFRSSFSFSRSMRLFEERRETDRQAAVFINLLFTFVTGIFISLSLSIWGAKPLWESYTLSILFFTLATGLLYFLKAHIWQILGVVFNVQVFSRLYIHNMFLYNRNTGLIIFPFVAILPYISESIAPVLAYCVISIFAISYLLRLCRIFQIIHDQNVSVFYFILYLCTLEILPLLLFIKGCKVLSEFNLFQ